MPDGGKTDAIVLESRAGDDFLHSQACFSAVSMIDGEKAKRAGEGHSMPCAMEGGKIATFISRSHNGTMCPEDRRNEK